MKIVADEKIPLIQHYFGGLGELNLVNGRDMKKEDVVSADMLIVRSVTKVNEDLLNGSSVQFVGSVTTGDDHLDTAWLQSVKIPFYVAHGCNAYAVVEYVASVIAHLQKMHFLQNKRLKAAVIGVGFIGSQVVTLLKTLGFDVIQCDPLRALHEHDFQHTPLDKITDVDFITLHTPLTYSGDYPTYHMVQKKFFMQQRKGTILLNSGRGSVIKFSDLKLYGGDLVWCLDVWEDEPYIDYQIMDSAFLATPHIAGHSIQSKYRAIQMVYQACIKQGVISKRDLPTVDFPTRTFSLNHRTVDWRDLALSIYDPMQTTIQMKKWVVEKENGFDELRNQYNKDEFHFVVLKDMILKDENGIARKLFTIK